MPGVRAGLAPPDAVYLIPAGSDLTAQVHYVCTGKTETDSSRIGISLADRGPDAAPIRKTMNIIYLSGGFGVVPPRVTELRGTGTYTLPRAAELTEITPHAHLLARWMEVRAWLPNEQKPQLVIRVPKWDYHWPHISSSGRSPSLRARDLRWSASSTTRRRTHKSRSARRSRSGTTSRSPTRWCCR